MSDTIHGNGFDGRDALAAFEGMLDAFGADADRWPLERRHAAEALLRQQDAAGSEARRALAEARALDSVLAAVPAFDDQRLASLTSRIVLEAQQPTATGNVVLLPMTRAADRRKAIATARPRGQWMAAAMLAASLLVGVVIGPGNTGLPALHDAADAFGLGGYVDQLALAPAEDDGSPDEDVL